MKNFDIFVGIDWSGAKQIHTKAIAVAACEQGRDAPALIANPYGHKYWSREAVARWVIDMAKSPKRIMIGIDANFGYAQEVGVAQFGKAYNYNALWAAVESAAKENKNFFAKEYWETHPEHFWWEGKQPKHITLPKRITEHQCAADGYGRPESPFKLIGAKQVGKGGLAVMRMVYHLKQTLGDQICIWPFEREQADTARIVISEIYPRQFLMRSHHGLKKISTFQQLNAAYEGLESSLAPDDFKFSDHDADALVSATGLRMLCGKNETLPQNITNPKSLTESAAKREGWIFGVGDKG